MALLTLPRARGMTLAEWQAIRNTAAARVRRRHAAIEASRARLADTASQTARADVARTTRSWLKARRDLLMIRTIWTTDVRADELLTMAFERTEWFDDGWVRVIVLGKAAPRRADAFDPSLPPIKRERETAIPPAVSSPLREWISDVRMTPTLPTTGPLWATSDGRAPSPSTLEAAVHSLAVEAGVQRFQGPSEDNPVPGHLRASHKYLVSAHAIRELAERFVIPIVGADMAAKNAGHTRATQERSYNRAGYDEAQTVVKARARHA